MLKLGVGDMCAVLSAVWLLNKASEMKVELPLRKGNGLEQLVDLLPSCTALLQNCGNKLLMLCVNSFNLGHGDSAPFNLDAPSQHRILSMEKWLSWRKNFQDLSQREDRALLKRQSLALIA